MSTSRNRLLAFVLLTATFLVGLVAGVTLDRVALMRERRLIPRQGRFMSERVVKRLDRELDLTPQQEEEVRAIIERRRGSMEKFWGEMRPRLSAEMEATHDEIESVLTPQQRERFEKLTERWRQLSFQGWRR